MSIARNIAANAFVRLWAAVLQFIFTPIYLSVLGAEAYGLVGFYTTLISSLAFLDQALSPILMREFARLKEIPGSELEMRDTLRSLEVLSFGVALLLGLGIVVLAPAIATEWLHVRNLSQHEVETAVRLMGLVTALQWPTFLYTGGYIGLNQQPLLAAIRLPILTAQWGGAALLLWFVAPNVELLFGWQAFTFFVLSGVLSVKLWEILPSARARPRFDWHRIHAQSRFAIGTLLIGLSASLLTQLDKLVVSKYVPLAEFAAYSLGFVVSGLISGLVVAPMGSAILPHLIQVTAEGNKARLAHEYHRWTQLLMVLVLPAAGMLITFPIPIVNLWLGEGNQINHAVARLLPYIAIGTAFNAITTMPFLLQLAAGWTRLSVIKNAIALCLIVPALFLGVPKYGMMVGVWCWIAVNSSYYLVEAPVMHQRLLKGELHAWWLLDTAIPICIGGTIFFLANLITPSNLANWQTLVFALLTSTITAGVLLLVLPHARTYALSVILRLKTRPGRI